MFTGIVEEIGTVAETERNATGLSITVGAASVISDAQIGGSIAVNGVCLTAVLISESSFRADVVAESLEKTNLGGLGEGDRVNLERPMRASSRFDGHMVQGHVDTVGLVTAVGEDGKGSYALTVEVEASLAPYLVEKGSITVDGVSLTIASVAPTAVTVALIPHTLAVTTLSDRNVNDYVNLEMDVIAKYVARYIEHYTLSLKERT